MMVLIAQVSEALVKLGWKISILLQSYGWFPRMLYNNLKMKYESNFSFGNNFARPQSLRIKPANDQNLHVKLRLAKASF